MRRLESGIIAHLADSDARAEILEAACTFGRPGSKSQPYVIESSSLLHHDLRDLVAGQDKLWSSERPDDSTLG